MPVGKIAERIVKKLNSDAINVGSVDDLWEHISTCFHAVCATPFFIDPINEIPKIVETVREIGGNYYQHL